MDQSLLLLLPLLISEVVEVDSEEDEVDSRQEDEVDSSALLEELPLKS
jgi:hypothetical protein